MEKGGKRVGSKVSVGAMYNPGLAIWGQGKAAQQEEVSGPEPLTYA